MTFLVESLKLSSKAISNCLCVNQQSMPCSNRAAAVCCYESLGRLSTSRKIDTILIVSMCNKIQFHVYFGDVVPLCPVCECAEPHVCALLRRCVCEHPIHNTLGSDQFGFLIAREVCVHTTSNNKAHEISDQL